MQELRVIFTGRVQGVFFRANTERVAKRLKVSGYVKNMRDGKVEAVFQGEPAILDGIVAQVVKGQNAMARVESFETESRKAETVFNDFIIVR